MTTIKNFLFAIALLVTFFANAQESVPKNGIAIGFHINQYHRDFGIGLNLTSPYFAKGHVAVRLRVNCLFNEHEQNAVETVWTPYPAFSLGFVSSGGMIGEHIRLYGEGGPACLLPAPEFSSSTAEFGGYGLFGFEFFTSSFSTYFIELGGIGTGAVADKIPKKPVYANGLLLHVGFRFTL